MGAEGAGPAGGRLCSSSESLDLSSPHAITLPAPENSCRFFPVAMPGGFCKENGRFSLQTYSGPPFP